MSFCFQINIAQVCVNGVDGDIQVAGDSFTAFGLGDKADDFFFSTGKHNFSFQ